MEGTCSEGDMLDGGEDGLGVEEYGFVGIVGMSNLKHPRSDTLRVKKTEFFHLLYELTTTDHNCWHCIQQFVFITARGALLQKPRNNKLELPSALFP